MATISSREVPVVQWFKAQDYGIVVSEFKYQPR